MTRASNPHGSLNYSALSFPEDDQVVEHETAQDIIASRDEWRARAERAEAELQRKLKVFAVLVRHFKDHDDAHCDRMLSMYSREETWVWKIKDARAEIPAELLR